MSQPKIMQSGVVRKNHLYRHGTNLHGVWANTLDTDNMDFLGDGKSIPNI